MPANELKRRSVILMIVLTVITLGAYYPAWFLRRRAALNRLNSPRKLQLWPFLVFLAFYVLVFIIALASDTTDETTGTGASVLFRLARLAVGILMVAQCFFIKDILEDHLAGPEENAASPLLRGGVSLSGIMTFFFQIFYLQHVINRHIAGSEPKAA